MNEDDDPRLALTPRFVPGRELIDDAVLLADFEQILEWGGAEPESWEIIGGGKAAMEWAGLCDRHGRQLLYLARAGAQTHANTGEPPICRGRAYPITDERLLADLEELLEEGEKEECDEGSGNPFAVLKLIDLAYFHGRRLLLLAQRSAGEAI